MARLRKKEQWLDHARAMLEGMSLAKAAERVHPTTAFRWCHRFLGSCALDKPKTLTGIVEADETFILESFKGRRSGLRRRPRKRGGKAKHPGLFFGNIPILVARHRDGATVDAVLPNVDSVSIAAVLDGLVTLRRRKGRRCLRPQGEHPGSCRARAGQAQTEGNSKCEWA